MKPRRPSPPQLPLQDHPATPAGMRALADELDAALPTAPPSPVSAYLRSDDGTLTLPPLPEVSRGE